jgi:hypothetical protein
MEEEGDQQLDRHMPNFESSDNPSLPFLFLQEKWRITHLHYDSNVLRVLDGIKLWL